MTTLAFPRRRTCSICLGFDFSPARLVRDYHTLRGARRGRRHELQTARAGVAGRPTGSPHPHPSLACRGTRGDCRNSSEPPHPYAKNLCRPPQGGTSARFRGGQPATVREALAQTGGIVIDAPPRRSGAGRCAPSYYSKSLRCSRKPPRRRDAEGVILTALCGASARAVRRQRRSSSSATPARTGQFTGAIFKGYSRHLLIPGSRRGGPDQASPIEGAPAAGALDLGGCCVGTDRDRSTSRRTCRTSSATLLLFIRSTWIGETARSSRCKTIEAGRQRRDHEYADNVDIITGYDAIIDGTGYFETRYLLN